MRILFDSCVWGGAKSELLQRGHDTVWCGDWQNDPGDEAVLEMARIESRVLVTLDKDFGEPAIVRRQSHCGIVRLVGFRAREKAMACSTVIERHGPELMQGAIATVTRHQIRI